MSVRQRSSEPLRTGGPMSSAPGAAHSSDSKGPAKKSHGTALYLLVCVLGIYGSFLTWAVLQERISTTPYGDDQRIFRASNAISVVQSVFAFIAGLVFLKFTGKLSSGSQAILPTNPRLVKSYAVVALCQTLSSPFSYASLKHVDYVTMLLAKSCKLVPVMAVHLTLHRTKFPAYKYWVVALVTLGVSVFNHYSGSGGKGGGVSGNRMWGFFLLGCGLFLDGLYNTTQDAMFREFGKTGEVSGPQMMVVLNMLTSVFSLVALVVGNQWSEVLWFVQHHPGVFRDIALFALCGAVGQIFIFLTLEQFGSLVLVTTTVTRKMISMLLSVVMFNHSLKGMQWLGVLLVFGGVAGEALYKQLVK